MRMGTDTPLPTHTRIHTHTHTRETVKGLISFEERMGQVPYFSNFKTHTPPHTHTHELRMPHSASRVAKSMVGSFIFFLSENNPASGN